jgi:hypothetical protein
VAPQPHRSKPNLAPTTAQPWRMEATRPTSTSQLTGRHRRSGPVPAAPTTVNPALGDTSWWPDVDEPTFHARQDAGMAALIAVATHAARF